MPPSHRLLAITATALALSACKSGDDATLNISLGSTLQALTLEGVDVSRYELKVTCVDGSEETVTGDVSEEGTFSAEVSRCPQAKVRFRGMTSGNKPALAGFAEFAVRPPVTDVVIPVRRAGTVTFVNDDTYTSVCLVRVVNAPEFEKTFRLEPGQSQTEVLPVNGSNIACAPAATCGAANVCEFDGPLAINRNVAVNFGGDSTLSLANLANGLVFTIGPPSPLIAGGTFGPFQVTLIDEVGAAIPRSDVTVTLVADSSVEHGGFVNGTMPLTNGVASFNGVGFTTAGSLRMRAEANVDGVLLQTDVRTIQVDAGLAAVLQLIGPTTAAAGVPFALSVGAVDAFGNTADVPSSITLSSNDPLTSPQVVDLGTRASQGQALAVVVDGIQYTLFTAGSRTVTARSSANSNVSGAVTLSVTGGSLAALELTRTVGPNLVVNQDTDYRVTARDAYGNVVTGYTGTVALQAVPVTGLVYGGPHVFTAGDAGSFVFTNVHYTVATTYTLVAAEGPLVSAPLTVNVVPAGTLDHFDVVSAVSSAVAGELFNITITARDPANGVASAFIGTVYIESSGNCSVSSTFNASDAGVRVEELYCHRAGAWPLHANYLNNSNVGDSAPMTITPGGPYRIVLVENPPATVVQDQRFGMAVQVVDSYDNATALGSFAIELTMYGGVGNETLRGQSPTVVRNIITFPELTVDRPATGLYIVATVVPSYLEVNSTATGSFDVTASSCPVAYVQPGANGSGCNAESPVGSIAAALDAVDVGGEIHLRGGSYTEGVSLGKSVTVRGGYTQFMPTEIRSPLSQPSKIQPEEELMAAVEVTEGASVVLDGVLMQAHTPSGASSVWALRIIDNASAIVESCGLVGPVFEGSLDDSGVIEIANVRDVIVRNNWIHTGGSAEGLSDIGERDGITISGSNPGSIYIVHNTFFVAPAVTSQAVKYEASNIVELTNNLIVGDFRDCGSDRGVCVVREAFSSLYSAQNNMVLQPSTDRSPIYLATEGRLYESLNGPATDGRGLTGFSGNVERRADPLDVFVDFAGNDGKVYTMQDDDWHLRDFSGYAIGLDAIQTVCGSNGSEWCGGSPVDIDREPRGGASSVGADDKNID